MSTNPFSPHTSNLFASRGCDVNSAMIYARELLDNINPEDRAAATTALMVVINTAANAFDQARGPSPEKLAVEDMIRAFVVREMDNQSDRMLEAINDAVREWNNDNLGDRIREIINEEDIHSDHIRETVKDMVRDGDFTVSLDLV